MKYEYEDIVGLPYPPTQKSHTMSMTDRAAQFSPFAALKGYDELLENESRFLEDRTSAAEEREREIDAALHALLERAQSHPRVRVVHFVRDEEKEGGIYVTTEGPFRGMDLQKRILRVGERTVVLDDLREVVIEE